jgi:pimeloyl-ACP methyl ester carboxylesterase
MTDPNREYRTLPGLWRAYEEVPRRLRFNARTPTEWHAWHEALVQIVWDLLGHGPRDAYPLEPKVIETSDEGSFRLEKISLRCDADVFMPCYVLIPKLGYPPYRPVLALHGHGIGGAAHLVGRHVTDEQRREEDWISSKNYDYARQLAERGYLVIAPEQRGFGERMERGVSMVDYADGHPFWASTCRALQHNALLLGKTAIGLRVWDAMRAIDYLRTRPEPQTERLACVGLSGGASTAMFLAALDQRVWATVLSGYFSSFRAYLMPYIACECNYIPRILEFAEMADLAALIAPRPLLIQAGRYDETIPIKATETAFEDLRPAYSLLDADHRLVSDFFDGGHAFNDAAFAFLERWTGSDG